MSTATNPDLLIPTAAPGGSPEKVEVLRLRASLRLPLWHPNDNPDRRSAPRSRRGNDKLQAPILEAIRRNGPITGEDVWRLLRQQGMRVKRMNVVCTITALVRLGRLAKQGRRRGRMYYVPDAS